MIRISQDEWRRAFSGWLRTGRLPVQDATEAELKFNPWHDPDDGRFTFAGSGVYYGRGSSRSGDKPRRRPRPKVGRRLPRGAGVQSGGGATGGGGAGGSWEPSAPEIQRVTSQLIAEDSPGETGTSTGGSDKPAEKFRTVIQNGYSYKIDSRGRTRRVSGVLVFSLPVRSRAMQTQAGGADRRHTDDGGHYIAARFNGPTEAFNHFAQNANFNRGGYRLLEDQWAKAIRAGKSVTVKIVPRYIGRSARPARIDVTFAIDGRKESRAFPNERSEKRGGK